MAAFVIPVCDRHGWVAQRRAQPCLHFAGARALGDGVEDRSDAGAAGKRRAEQAGEEKERHGREGHDQRDADDRVADAGEGRDDEADREQQHAQPAGEVHRAQLPAQCRDGRPRCRRGNVRRVVVRDEDEIVGACVRLARLRPRREHRVEQRREEGGRVRGCDDRSPEPADQPAARICQQQVNEGRDEEAADDRAERVRERRVRLVQAVREHAEADRDHQHAGAICRPSRPADQAGGDEGHADEQQQRGRVRRMLVVVARQRQRHRCRAGRQCRRPEEEPGPPRQGHAAKSAAIAAPDSSAFGTKPRAPHSPMQRP